MGSSSKKNGDQSKYSQVFISQASHMVVEIIVFLLTSRNYTNLFTDIVQKCQAQICYSTVKAQQTTVFTYLRFNLRLS
jgi:hypothetical protein